MKKFLVVAFVLAAVCISTAAYAIDVTVNGEAAVRSRLFENIGSAPQPNSHKDNVNDAYTQTRFILEVNVKGEGFKGKLAVWNDHDTWKGRGLFDSGSGNNIGTNGASSTVFIREAWIDFMVPGTPVGVKAGRMNGMLGQGWFERSMYGGQEAWVLYANLGKVATIALQDVKINEFGSIAVNANTTTLPTSTGTDTATNKDRNDVDLYSLIATIKPADAVTIGLDISYLKDNYGTVLNSAPQLTSTFAPSSGAQIGPNAHGWLWNVGLNYNVKAGPATIKGQFDVQSGTRQNFGAISTDFDGFQGIIQASIPVSIVTINAGAAYGSGNRPGSSNNSQIVVLSDSGQHYSYIYEYRLRGATNLVNTMLANTWFIVGGVMVQATKSLAVGFDTYYLQASEMVALNQSAHRSKDLGIETDVKVNWQINPNLSWNWTLAWFSTGAAYRNTLANGDGMSDAYAVQGSLSLKF